MSFPEYICFPEHAMMYNILQIGFCTCLCVHTGYSELSLQFKLHESRGARQVHNATPTRTTPFSKKKGAGTRTHGTLLSRQSALPTELPGQLSRQGSKSATQHMYICLQLQVHTSE